MQFIGFRSRHEKCFPTQDPALDTFLYQSQVQRQQQVLAPQLRQSLEILQAPMLELQALVTRELELNPTLELLEPSQERIEIEPESTRDFEDVSDREFEEEFEQLARLDDDNRDSFRRNEVLQRPSSDDEAKRQFMLESMTASPTLQQHLMEQLTLSPLEGFRRQLAEMIIGSLDDDGYLTTPLAELAASIGADAAELEKILAVLRDFEPVGVASRSLQECLLKQLERQGKRQSLEAQIVEFHLRDLASHKYGEIAKRLEVEVEDVVEATEHIALLDPKPGRAFASAETVYVMPEVFVRKVRGRWRVRTNDEVLPRLRISKQYRDIMRDPTSSKEVRRYIRDKVRAGGFLMKSIGQRQETLRRIGEEVVAHQEAFLEEGVEKLKPLTMSEIAQKLGLHETTISRAIANKYIQTPAGVFELKYFFTPGYQSDSGEMVSNKTIKDAIQKLVDNEDIRKPLSDQAMVKALQGQGLKVARRTIAKYRDELRILPSHMRKKG